MNFEPPPPATADRPVAWALAYAKAGMAVFPVAANKRPLTEHGFKDASANEAAPRAWWARYPYAGIGWAVPAGIVVVDLDCKRRGNGAKDFAEREGAHPDDVDTPQASTPTGGRHLVYEANGAVYRNNVRLDGSAIDLRTAGGYVALPMTGNGRAWLKPLSTPLKPVPQWIQPADARSCGAKAGLPGAVAAPGESAPQFARYALDMTLRGIVKRVEGERNCIVFWAACRLAELVRDGLLDEAWAAELLLLAACRAGLPDGEARRTIASGLKTAMS